LFEDVVLLAEVGVYSVGAAMG